MPPSPGGDATSPSNSCISSDTVTHPASYGVFQSLLPRLDAKALEHALARWVEHLLGDRVADARVYASSSPADVITFAR